MTIESDECLFDPNKLTEISKRYLHENSVNLKLNTLFNLSNLKDYDYVINATYSNLNFLITENELDYQFELCEKPVIKLPDKYQNYK